MANKRMFARSLIESDAFLDMPLSAQALYFHLAMRADDDGFVNSPRKIQREVRCSEDDMKLLIAKNFVLIFQSGVIVIRHWKLHNYIQTDRYKETLCQDEKSLLLLDKKKGEYAFADALPAGDSQPCIQSVSNMDTQIRLDKSSLVEISVDKRSIEGSAEGGAPKPGGTAAPEKPERHKHGQYGWVKLSDAEYSNLLNDLGETELNRCITYVDESAQSNGNRNKWKDWNLVIRKCHREGWGMSYRPKREDTGGTDNPFLNRMKERRGQS